MASFHFLFLLFIFELRLLHVCKAIQAHEAVLFLIYGCVAYGTWKLELSPKASRAPMQLHA